MHQVQLKKHHQKAYLSVINQVHPLILFSKNRLVHGRLLSSQDISKLNKLLKTLTGKMKTFWTFLVFLPSFTLAVQTINDVQTYKPCINDVTECPSDQVCIQYFCYPKEAGKKDPLKSCNKNSQCDGWRPSKTEKCFKEGQNGVCIPADDYELCESHEECEGRGEKCCGDYCCNPEYFDALISQIVCDSNDNNCLVIFSKNNQYFAHWI